MIPDKLCLLKKISIMDLSKNSFSGTMPQCFHNIGFGKINATEFSYAESDATFVYGQLTDIYESVLKPHFEIFNLYAEYTIQVEVEFVTKYRSSSYKGGILDYMSGLDLSCNKLTGGIPLELGQLSLIHALNLSHNRLMGSIPETFSNLAMLESLDLSHNSLSGQIPSVLIDLNFLEVFSVAYNNLSGRVPDMKAQFGTFDKSSYEGNPFLCGLPLERSCTTVDERHPTSTKSPNVSHEKWYEVDPLVFFVTFSVSTIVFFFFTVSLLYIRPHWLQRCFNLIEDLLCCCYYSVVDTIRRLSNCLCH
ncbi:Receptor-like protein 2 [Morella rubra]|uniref:Receptor-like protein 2 n=1 Tax=Morella rubra TaxID=262757 RepID=A0A6A1V4P5_9ROSI|nr:Receptor-like protein 2 [Morella rubra]